MKIVFWKRTAGNNLRISVGETEWTDDDAAPPTVLVDQEGGHWIFWNLAKGVFNYQNLTEDDRGEVIITPYQE